MCGAERAKKQEVEELRSVLRQVNVKMRSQREPT
jgi:hypothetical protein